MHRRLITRTAGADVAALLRGEGDEREMAERTMGVPGLQVRQLQQLTVRAEADGTDDAGTFDGYACVWDVKDSYGTTFRRGCFVEGGLDQSHYALLWMHSPWEPIGIFYATEDDHGLKIAGRWDDTQTAQDKRVMAKSGSAPGLSVGFVPLGTDPDDPSVFTVCRLVETSQITARMAAVPGAQLVGVRMDPDHLEVADRAARLAIARLQLTTVRSR